MTFSLVDPLMKQIPHPGYPQHRWAGMVLQPAIFALINAKPFVPPPNPGLIAIYPPFALQPAIWMTDSQYKIDKNMYKRYTNVHQAVYNLLVENVLPQYQASNMSGLTGWDATMTIIDIFAQLDVTFEKPDAQAILVNNANFRAPLLPIETPEILFLRLEECQEVQILAANPYTDKQPIVNAVIVLRKANIFPTKDFDDWEALPLQTWATLKIKELLPQSLYTSSQRHQHAPNIGTAWVHKPKSLRHLQHHA